MTEDNNNLPNGRQARALDTNPDDAPSIATTETSLTEQTCNTRDNGEEITAQAMTLDVAYKSLEMVRQVNQQLEFRESEFDKNECITCKREEQNSLQKSQRRFKQWISRKGTSPCLTCGTPVCSSHRSSDFSKQNIIICLDCAHLFSTEYIIEQIMNNHDEAIRKKLINGMLEVYDRAMLIFKFSIQFIDEVAMALEENTSRHNKVGLGSSATGVMAGGLGVAAAVTILTPVGPPLLLASILFGGSATAVNASSEAVNYRCEPNKMADRILTLHSVLVCISRLPAKMDMQEEHTDAMPESENNQSSLHWTRTVMNGCKPLTLGALSAVSIVTEAREMKSTVDKIRAGNPCDKAKRLREIKEEAGNNIPTDILSSQMEVIINRPSQVGETNANSCLL